MEKAQAKKKDKKPKEVANKDVAKKEATNKSLRKEPAKAIAKTEKRELLPPLKKFFKGSWSELKKVQWPNKKQLIAFTGVVLLSVAIVSLMIWIVDSILSFGLTKLFK